MLIRLSAVKRCKDKYKDFICKNMFTLTIVYKSYIIFNITLYT